MNHELSRLSSNARLNEEQVFGFYPNCISICGHRCLYHGREDWKMLEKVQRNE